MNPYEFWSEVEEHFKLEHSNDDGSKIRKAIDKIRSPFKKGSRFSEFSEIDFNKELYIRAYLRYFAPAHVIISYRVASNFFKELKAKFSFKRDELRVVSVGGGPGMDLYGFCAALASKPSIFSGQLKTFILDRYHWQGAARVAHELLINSDEPWAKAFKCVMPDQPNCREVDFRDRRQMRIQRKLISSSDVILVVKVLTVLDTGTANSLIEEIFDGMSPQSIVIFVDACLYNYNLRRVNFRLLQREHTKVYENFTHNESVQKSSYEVCVLQKYVVNNDDIQDDRKNDESDEVTEDNDESDEVTEDNDESDELEDYSDEVEEDIDCDEEKRDNDEEEDVDCDCEEEEEDIDCDCEEEEEDIDCD